MGLRRVGEGAGREPEQERKGGGREKKRDQTDGTLPRGPSSFSTSPVPPRNNGGRPSVSFTYEVGPRTTFGLDPWGSEGDDHH